MNHSQSVSGGLLKYTDGRDTRARAVSAEESFPLQQFFFTPWLWAFFAQHRREVDAPRSRLAWLYQGYFFSEFDVAFHLIVLAMTRGEKSAR